MGKGKGTRYGGNSNSNSMRYATSNYEQYYLVEYSVARRKNSIAR